MYVSLHVFCSAIHTVFFHILFQFGFKGSTLDPFISGFVQQVTVKSSNQLIFSFSSLVFLNCHLFLHLVVFEEVLWCCCIICHKQNALRNIRPLTYNSLNSLRGPTLVVVCTFKEATPSEISPFLCSGSEFSTLWSLFLR